MKRKNYDLSPFLDQIEQIHTSEMVYKELRMPLTSLQVTIKKLSDTDPSKSANLQEGWIMRMKILVINNNLLFNNGLFHTNIWKIEEF